MEDEKLFKHPYTDGDILVDTEHNEMFIFKDRKDGYLAENIPSRLRHATNDEKQLFTQSGGIYLKIHPNLRS